MISYILYWLTFRFSLNRSKALYRTLHHLDKIDNRMLFHSYPYQKRFSFNLYFRKIFLNNLNEPSNLFI